MTFDLETLIEIKKSAGVATIGQVKFSLDKYIMAVYLTLDM